MAAMAHATSSTIAQRGLMLWARVAIGGFYRRVRVMGDPAVLRGRPAVIAANHSNALGDIAVLLTVLPQFPRFLAASTWWDHAPVRALFRAGKVLPVERRSDGSGQRNRDTFAACHGALASADHVAIFPEGMLNSGEALLPLRTGAARIAMSAALDVDVRGLVIVPVAIAYEDRGRVRSDVVATFGTPIEIDEWTEQGETDPVGTIREMTDLLQEQLADAHALGRSQLKEKAAASATERQLRTARVALLAPVAAAGVAANAPAVLPIAIGAQLIRHDGWQATAKGIGATVLLPLTWAVAGCLVARRWGAARGALTVAGAAASGAVSLTWLGLVRDRPDTQQHRDPSPPDRDGGHPRSLRRHVYTSTIETRASSPRYAP